MEKTVQKDSPFIDDLLPDQRVEAPEKTETGEWIQWLIGDPVFFFVHPHRFFDRIQAEVWFINEGQPIVELGGFASLASGAYDLFSLQNLFLDKSDWYRLEEKGMILLSRDKPIDSFESFYQNLPERNTIATYHAQIEEPYRLASSIPSQTPQTIEVSLRGYHAIKTYVKDEDLSMTFSFMDMNREEGDDPVHILVFNEQEQAVAEARFPDDGNVSAEAIPSGLQTLSLFASDLPEGVYKVELNVDRDIIFRSLTTTQQKIVFLNNLYLADEVGYQESPRPVTVWTSAQHFAFQTRHIEGVQEVVIGSEIVDVEEPYTRYSSEIFQKELSQMTSPVGDLEIESDGYFAFSPSQYFSPDPIKLTTQTDLDALGIKYLLATYTPPVQEGEWIKATVMFDTSKLVFEEGSWKFAFSLPDIEGEKARVGIGKIRLTLFRDPFTWKDFFSALKSYVSF